MARGLALLAAALAICGATAGHAGAASSLSPAPAGANNFSCKPTAAHPLPVVLVHGLGGTSGPTFSLLAPQLRAQGYCYFSLNYGMNPLLPGIGGLSPIEDSAPALGALVDRVLAATGARQVDLVGASEGTFMPQYWLKELGGAPKVSQYVAIAPLYDGTKSSEFLALGSLCGACSEFQYESPMVRLLQTGGIAAPGVHYTAIMTRYDEAVIPYTSGRIDEPGQTNIVLQNICPLDLAEHALSPGDPTVIRLTLNALDPATAKPVICPFHPG